MCQQNMEKHEQDIVKEAGHAITKGIYERLLELHGKIWQLTQKY